MKQDFVMNSEATSTILKGLDYFTTYNVSIAALTSSISGDFSEFATVTTDEDGKMHALELSSNKFFSYITAIMTNISHTFYTLEPSEPRNTRLLSATNGTLTICFDQPLKPNGILKNYKIIYNNSEVSIPFEKNMSYCYTREHLESYKNYSVIVKACNSKLCSSNAQSILFTTDVGGNDCLVRSAFERGRLSLSSYSTLLLVNSNESCRVIFIFSSGETEISDCVLEKRHSCFCDLGTTA